MDINLIKTFLEVYRVRHFGNASENLFITQSAVSARIQLLETQLGSKLFDRTRSGIQPTSAGLRFLPHAESILESWQRATKEVCEKQDQRQLLTIGIQHNIWEKPLPEWLGIICEDFPEINFNVVSETAENLNKLLANSSVDLVFLLDPPQQQELRMESVTEISLTLVSSIPDICLDSSMKKNYIFVNWGTGFSIAHSIHFPDAPPPMMQVKNTDFALELLLRRRAQAYLSKNQTDDLIAAKKLFHVANAPEIKRTIYSAYSQRNSNNLLIKTLLKKINKRASDNSPYNQHEKVLANIA